jgi:hypothetical protein
LTDEEADALDELLARTTPKLNPGVQGPFIRHRETVVVLDTFSAEYLKAKMSPPCVIFFNKVREEDENSLTNYPIWAII